jgi:NAD(P)H-dependent FMN reductase
VGKTFEDSIARLTMQSDKHKKILIISGSPRKESKSARVVKHLYKVLEHQQGFKPDILDVRNHPLPVFEFVFEDLESTPDLYKPLAEKIFQADAYIIVSPEYNGSYTAALQNLFDHFPRQHKKVYAIATATNGSMGGMRASQQLLLFILALFGIVSPYMLVIPFVDRKFDETGALLDETFQPKIEVFLDQFKWLVSKIDSY